MNEYEFTLKYATGSPGVHAEELLNSLFESGCDDAVVGVGLAGRLALQFDREAYSAMEAVASAMQDVARALPGAKLIEADPDMVSLTDMAERLKFSRQNMRKIMLNNAADFPLPIHDGTPAIWHLAPVLEWFQTHSNRYFMPDLYELARVTMQVNLVRDMRQLDATISEQFKELA